MTVEQFLVGQQNGGMGSSPGCPESCRQLSEKQNPVGSSFTAAIEVLVPGTCFLTSLRMRQLSS